ncbi:putative TetR family transcriptional regulator [Gordonia hirsuta DSM 44140 = NBRC 16056]|uniref:Putative TetR family transcriptional regulator n=1 Tax=Gordonia hirsuta DSM 44140 = NBRC 16056 TaxID=1121927 RepID=L7L9M6_9ACTN|nr:putative TetR family transcriptional regulator [Gordonia hirsuta DSM 44140 = NBRC 16056]
MPMTELPHDDPEQFRQRVVAESIRLFAEQGYEATTVDDVAAATGSSRRTLYRQFGSKEGLIFGDHETLLTTVAAQLTAADGDPWWAVCQGAQLVFAHFAANVDVAARRYEVVSQVPALRDRELVMASRYQRLFEDYLRARRPDVPRTRIVAYAAAVTGLHNYLLRRMSRGDTAATAQVLDEELQRLHRTLTQE